MKAATELANNTCAVQHLHILLPSSMQHLYSNSICIHSTSSTTAQHLHSQHLQQQYTLVYHLPEVKLWQVCELLPQVLLNKAPAMAV